MHETIARLRDAVNAHDVDAMVELIAPEYRSEQPAHPNRGFGGKEQVRKNWSRMFDAFPDFRADLLGHAFSEGTVWSEWRWSATGLNMTGVTLLGVRKGRIVWGRLYMEPVEEGGEDIDESVHSITEGA